MEEDSTFTFTSTTTPNSAYQLSQPDDPDATYEPDFLPTSSDSDDASPSHEHPHPPSPTTTTPTKRKQRNRPQGSSSSLQKKPKLRTSKDVHSRLKWDSASIILENGEALNPSSIYIGYKDRFLGICEISFEEFQPFSEGGDIPYHRIYYFRSGGPPVDPMIGRDGEVRVREHNWPEGTVILWDRESRKDLIFHSGSSSNKN